jgi:hypothetical protein
MIAKTSQQVWALFTQATTTPYNRGDFNNGWPDNIGCPQYLRYDLGDSLRSRFALPASPWVGSSNAALETLILWADIWQLGTETFDPPPGYHFVGPNIPGDPWRSWKDTYDYWVDYGPVSWDNYIYRAYGEYIVPTYREIALNPVTMGVIPLLTPLLLLFPLLFGSSGAIPTNNATNNAGAGRRRKRALASPASRC